MNHITELLNASIQDAIFSRGEKRALKDAIANAQLDKRELDLLRSKIFDLAVAHQNAMSKEQLINWLESTSKLTLVKKDEGSGFNESYFSPGTACRSAILNQIKNAKSSLRICVFTISDNEIAEQIIQAHKRNISVKVLTDNDKSFDKGSDIDRIHHAGVPVKIDRTESHMHHKFCVTDKATLLTGSYNWTRSAAERNQENILITDQPKVVKDFVREFDRLWEKLAEY